MNQQAENEEKQKNLRSFLLLYSGQLVSIFGSSIANFVIIWWIAISTGSIFYLTAAALVGMLPQILLSPMIGVLIDRLNNNKVILFFSDFLQAFVTLFIIASLYTNQGNIWFILFLLLIKEIFQSFHTPTFFTVIPMMVPKNNLSQTNSLMSFLSSLVNIVAPIVAASLLVIFQIADILWIDIITFLVAVVPLLLITIPKIDHIVTSNEQESKNSIFKDMKEGITYLRSQQGLFPLLLSFAMVNATIVPMGSYMVLLIKDFHQGTAQDYATVLAFGSIGVLLTSLIFTKIKINKIIPGLITGIIMIFVGEIMIGLTPKGYIEVVFIADFIIGCSVITASICSSTLWQKTVPFKFQGRINSLRMSFASMAQPLGVIVGGILAYIISIPGMYLTLGIVGLIIFLSFVLFTNIRYIGKESQLLIQTESKEVSSQETIA